MNDFWPNTARDWFLLISGVAGTVVAIIAFYYKVFIGSKITEFKNNIHDLRANVHTQFGKHHLIEEFMNRYMEDARNIYEDMGKLGNSVSHINKELHELELDLVKELSNVKDSIARVETKVDIILNDTKYFPPRNFLTKLFHREK